MPTRIQLHRRAGWRKPPEAVVVVRPGRWGNPFAVGQPYRYRQPDGQVQAGTVTSRVHAVALYEQFILDRPDLQERIRDELAGRDLCCWCPPSGPCHADVLLRVANRTTCPSAST